MPVVRDLSGDPCRPASFLPSSLFVTERMSFLLSDFVLAEWAQAPPPSLADKKPCSSEFMGLKI